MHTPSCNSLFTNCSFDLASNKLNCYRGKDCMERFCKNLKEHAAKKINYEKKEMILLTDEENKSYEKQKVCYICKKKFVLIMTMKLNSIKASKSKRSLSLHSKI